MTSPQPVRSAVAPRPAGDSGRRIRVLLVDDQPMIGEAVRRMLASEEDIDFNYCSDPTKAIQAAAEFRPTVILQDLVMPEVDGLTMLRFYRANPATKDIPTIVLSTKEEPKVKAEAFTLGANDYLVKLPDPIELTARIRHHSRGYIAQIERNEAYAALKKSEERLAEDLAQAAKYVISLFPERLSGEITTDWLFIPSVALGGDAFGYHWIDPDHLAMYLLDVCGHGVQAALLSISAINVLRNQTLPATDFRSPTQVLTAINKVFQMDRHNEMYFTMWYGVYDKQKRRLIYANGGHPPAILMAGSSRETAELIELSQPGAIIGAFPEMEFAEEARDLPAFSRLYVFSDGIYEVTKPDETILTYEEFLQILTDSSRDAGPALEHAIRAIRSIRGGDQFEDDVSIIEFAF
jgi:sigma-B regulation protein RsbU (phosphoserine phosphatase)